MLKCLKNSDNSILDFLRGENRFMKQKTACLGLFSAVAIILGYVESLIPVFAGIPGIKLGLANLGVLFILKKYSFREAALVSVVRILVIGFMFGNLFSILYSLAGATLSMTVMTLMLLKTSFSQIGGSAAGGVFPAADPGHRCPDHRRIPDTGRGETAGAPDAAGPSGGGI